MNAPRPAVSSLTDRPPEERVSRPKRATHVALLLKTDRGGVGSVWTQLAEAFWARGYRVDLVMLWSIQGAEQAPQGVRVIELVPGLRHSRFLPSHYLAAFALARYLRHEAPDVLLAATTPINFIAILAKWVSRRQLRLVLSQHNPVSMTIKFKQYRTAPFMAQLVRRLYPLADAIVAVSSGVAEDLREIMRAGKAKIVIIHNPVTTSNDNGNACDAANHTRLAGYHSPLIVGAGRLAPQKGFADLIHALALLRDRREARLVILGEGGEREELERLINSLGLDDVVELPGRVSNPLAFMARADLFVLSSRYEGFGLVLVEALACGCPIIATDCMGGPADILGGGRFGRLVPVGDVEAMATAMADALEGPRPDADVLRRRAQDFNIDRIADQYCDVLGGSETASRRATSERYTSRPCGDE